MSIKTVREQIADIAQQLTVIKNTFDLPPKKFDTADLPALYTFIGRSVDDPNALGGDFVMEVRIYRIQVPVLPAGQGAPTEVEQIIGDILPEVKAFFRNRPNLQNLQGVQSAVVLGDSGPIRLTEYSGEFMGFEIYLEVTEYVQVTRVDY